jgi:hypothetical protein
VNFARCAFVGEGKRSVFGVVKLSTAPRKELEMDYSGFEGSADN